MCCSCGNSVLIIQCFQANFIFIKIVERMSVLSCTGKKLFSFVFKTKLLDFKRCGHYICRYLVDLREGVYYQKCHDPECKATNYKSQSMCICTLQTAPPPPPAAPHPFHRRILNSYTWKSLVWLQYLRRSNRGLMSLVRQSASQADASRMNCAFRELQTKLKISNIKPFVVYSLRWALRMQSVPNWSSDRAL